MQNVFFFNCIYLFVSTDLNALSMQKVYSTDMLYAFCVFSWRSYAWNVKKTFCNSLKPEICSYARKHFRFPWRVEFGTYVDVTACIPGDIIKPGDKLGNTPGAPEGANYENHKNNYFWTTVFNVKNRCLWWVWIKFLHMSELPNMPSNELSMWV